MVKSETKVALPTHSGAGECGECIHVQSGAAIAADSYPFCVYGAVLNKLSPASEGQKCVFALNHLIHPWAFLLYRRGDLIFIV